eukprot:3635281-Pyramimonas_sp.AAC.2
MRGEMLVKRGQGGCELEAELLAQSGGEHGLVVLERGERVGDGHRAHASGASRVGNLHQCRNIPSHRETCAEN